MERAISWTSCGCGWPSVIGSSGNLTAEPLADMLQKSHLSMTYIER